jgi:hypothetical protein
VVARHRGFEMFLTGARRVLVRRHGETFADAVVTAAREEYEDVRLRVPDIGGARNVFQPVMTVNGWLVALHRALQARGQAAEETIRVCQEVVDTWLHRVPRSVLRGLGWLAMSPPVRWLFEQQARRSQKREYAADFVWHVERGADGEVAFVFDECAVNKWYDAEDLRELKPYCNFVDVTYSRLMGMGVDATQTIGLGCEQCALRYKYGRETVIPRTLETIIPQARKAASAGN